MVGGTADVTGSGVGRHVVLIVGSRSNFCTGVALASDLVLTVAHCVLPGAEYKIVEFDAAHQPQLKPVTTVARHPGFKLETLLAHRATADVALLKLAAPLAAPAVPAPLTRRATFAVGERFTVAGYGVAVRGDGKPAAPCARQASSPPDGRAACRCAWSIQRPPASAQASAPARAIPEPPPSRRPTARRPWSGS